MRDEIATRARSHMAVADEIARLERRLLRLREIEGALIGRDIAIYLERVVSSATTRELSRQHGLHPSTISRICAAIEEASDHPLIARRIRAAEPKWF